MDANGRSRNPSPLEEDLTGARWPGTLDQEVVVGWHGSSYLVWIKGILGQATSENLEDDVDENSDQRGP